MGPSPRFFVDQNAVHDDDGIVDQHPHGDNKGTQRDTLQGRSAHQQDGERYGDRENEAESDNQTAAQSHGEDQDQNDDGNRFDQIPHKGGDRFIHLVGLKEDLVGGESGREGLHRFGQSCIDRLADIGHDGRRFQGECRWPGPVSR